MIVRDIRVQRSRATMKKQKSIHVRPRTTTTQKSSSSEDLATSLAQIKIEEISSLVRLCIKRGRVVRFDHAWWKEFRELIIYWIDTIYSTSESGLTIRLSFDIFSSATSVMDTQTTPKDFVSKWRTFQEAVQAARMTFEHSGKEEDLFSLRPQDLPANDSPNSSSNNKNKNNDVEDDSDDNDSDADPDIDELDLTPRKSDRIANHKGPTTSGVSKIGSTLAAGQKPREEMAAWELAYYHLVVDKSAQKIWAKACQRCLKSNTVCFGPPYKDNGKKSVSLKCQRCLRIHQSCQGGVMVSQPPEHRSKEPSSASTSTSTPAEPKTTTTSPRASLKRPAASALNSPRPNPKVARVSSSSEASTSQRIPVVVPSDRTSANTLAASSSSSPSTSDALPFIVDIPIPLPPTGPSTITTTTKTSFSSNDLVLDHLDALEGIHLDALNRIKAVRQSFMRQLVSDAKGKI